MGFLMGFSSLGVCGPGHIRCFSEWKKNGYVKCPEVLVFAILLCFITFSMKAGICVSWKSRLLPCKRSLASILLHAYSPAQCTAWLFSTVRHFPCPFIGLECERAGKQGTSCRPSELWGHRTPPVAQTARHGHWWRVFPSSQTPGEPASQHTSHWLVTYEYEHTFCLLLNWHFYFERIYIHVQLWIQGNCVSFTWCVVSVGGRPWEEVQSVWCHQDPNPLVLCSHAHILPDAHSHCSAPYFCDFHIWGTLESWPVNCAGLGVDQSCRQKPM